MVSIKATEWPGRDFLGTNLIATTTEIGLSLGMWFGEICSCRCLASRNKFTKPRTKTLADLCRPIARWPL